MRLLPLTTLWMYSALAVANPYAIITSLTDSSNSASCSFYCFPLSSIASNCGGSSSCLCSPATVSAVYTCASCQLLGKLWTWADLEYAFGEYATDCGKSGSSISYITLIPPC